MPAPRHDGAIGVVAAVVQRERQAKPRPDLQAAGAAACGPRPRERRQRRPPGAGEAGALEAGTVAVIGTIVRGRRRAVGVGEPKSDAGRRTLPLPPELVAMLVQHLAARGLTIRDRDELLFTAPDGGMLRYSNWLRRRWYPAAVAAGVGRTVTDEETGRRTYRGLGFHDLRRASATGLVAAGVDVKTAQAVLGHADSRVTLDLYAQVVTGHQKVAVDATAARFRAPTPRGGRGMESGSGATGDGARTRREGL
jgi:integrase